MKNKILTAIAGAAILVIVWLGYQSASISSRTGEDTPLYSVRRHDPYGTAALHDLLVERGVAVKTLETPDLDDADHGVLIQVLSDADFGERNPRTQTRQLIDWISQGNIVLQLTRASSDLLDRVKMAPTTRPSSAEIKSLSDFESDGGDPDDTPASVEMADTTVPGHPRLMLWSPAVFADRPGATWRTLARLTAASHAVVAGEVPIGKGKLIVVGAPTPAINGTIGSAGNLDFLLSLIGNRPVIFDEWSHGIGHDRTIVSFLRDVGLLPLLLQVALVAGLYAWSTSGYSAVPDTVERRTRSSAEQIQTLGYLYSRSLGPAATFQRVNQEVQHRLATALRCQPKELAARVRTLKPELREKIHQLITQLNNARPAAGVPCPVCGYDLSFNKSGKCPECGSALQIESLRKLREGSQSQPPGKTSDVSVGSTDGRRPTRFNARLVELLGLSHQLSLEVKRERRYAR